MDAKTNNELISAIATLELTKVFIEDKIRDLKSIIEEDDDASKTQRD